MVLVGWSANTQCHRRGIDLCWHTADIDVTGILVHVEIALQDSLLHSIRLLRLLRHLADGRFHDSNALRTMVTGSAYHGRRAGHGATLSSGAEVLREVVAFACG